MTQAQRLIHPTQHNNLNQWLTWLEAKHSLAIELGLDSIRQVAEQLDLTQFNVPVITVGGTNGKGSTIALLEHMYHKAGYRVAAYTSPHVLAFNERLRINTQAVSDENICQSFAAVLEHCHDIPVSYFEFITLAALHLFKQTELDVILLEVGLGGRLDAVNIVEHDCAVITTVDLDHQEWLGDDREAIGAEKAGIMRADKPIVFGDDDMPTSVLRHAQTLGAQLYQLNQDYQIQVDKSDCWAWHTESQEYSELPIPHLGHKNAATAIMVSYLLREQLPITEATIAETLKTSGLIGRFQYLPTTPKTLVDVAHNPQSANVLAQRLAETELSYVAVVAMLTDKDIRGTIEPLLKQVQHWHIASLDVYRGAHAQQLADILTDLGASYTQHETVAQAYAAALQGTCPVLVYGSLFTVAAVLEGQSDG